MLSSSELINQPTLRVFLNKLTITQLLKKFFAFYRSGIIMTFRKNLPPVHILSQMYPVRSEFPTYFKYNYILSSLLRLGLTSLFLLGFPTKFLQLFLNLRMFATYPVYSILLLDHPSNVCRRTKVVDHLTYFFFPPFCLVNFKQIPCERRSFTSKYPSHIEAVFQIASHWGIPFIHQ
jgi:uncharacterized membrane protein YphA (DoxX/SURF4 family)